DDPACDRSADRRGARRHPQQRRRSAPPRSGRRRARRTAIAPRRLRRAPAPGGDSPRQSRSALARGQYAAVAVRHRSRLDGARLQRGRHAHFGHRYGWGGGIVLEMRRIAASASALTLLLATVPAAAPPPPVEAAFQKFWSARNRDDAAKAAAAVVAAGVSFDDALARLKHGRPYSAKVQRGLAHFDRRSVAGQFFYDVDIPHAYDPERSYQVRVQLHGGVNARETSEPRARSIRPLPGDEQIYVYPIAWQDAPWWSRAQLENIDSIVDAVKRIYNVDENHVVLSGVSDGATGLYYVAMRDTTPFASFLALNGSMMVLSNDRLGVDADLFPTNLLNKPFFIVNGGQDPLYPTRAVEPYIGHLRGGGVMVDYHPRPEAGHNTAWWPDMKDAFERFVREHPRTPYPDTITWEATDRDLPSRAHWIVVDRVRQPSGAEPRP